MADFYSQASNFVAALTGGMDPRTGLFSATIACGRLVGNNELGPTLDLTLAATPLSTENVGFGSGWSFRLTRYDTATGKLSLSNGEQYRVLETVDGVVIEQKKLDNLRFERLDHAYKVTYPSGEIEMLSGPDDASSVKVPLKLFSPLGHWLQLKWKYGEGPQPRLASISDEKDTLLKVSYGGTKTTLTFWPGQTESYSISLIFLNDRVQRVENNAIEPPLKWNFTYTAVGDLWMLTGITDPAGLIDEVEYKADGHAFPQSAKLAPLPYVTRRTLTPGHGQPQQVTTYTYSDNNYLGGGTSSAWSPDEDYLYSWLSDYQYSSVETMEDGDTSVSTTRTYNNFHLLVKEEYAQGSCQRTTTTTYYAVVGKTFENQPAEFQSPKKVEVVYTDGDRIGKTETTHTEFDSSGNLTLLRDWDGTETRYEYYPAGGEGTDCPADPNGFVHWVKSQTTTPAAHSDLTAPVEKKVYKYRSMRAREGSVVKTAVVNASEETYSDGAKVLGRAFTYVNDRTSAEHGRPRKTTVTLYEADDESKTFENRLQLDYTVADDALTQKSTFTGYDNVSTTQSETRSRFSGRVRETIDTQDNKTSYAMDKLGRTLTKTVNPGTDYERQSTWSYTLETPSGSSVHLTSPTGNGSITTYDALSRPVQEQQLDVDGDDATQVWRVTMQTHYDGLGRRTSVTAYDTLRDTGQGEIQIEATQTLAYDNWNQLRATTYPDGHQDVSEYDPVDRVRKSSMIDANGGKSGTDQLAYNKQGLVFKHTRYSAKGELLTKADFHYDGLGRLRSTTDEMGHTTAYEYDAWRRLIKQTLPDNTVVTRSYDPGSTTARVADVTVAGKSLGSQKFDSLGRLKRSTSGGRTFSYQYEGASPRPAKVTTPAAIGIVYQYIVELDNVIEKVTAQNIGQSFEYDTKSSLVTSAKVDSGMARTMDYYPSGMVKADHYTSGTTTKDTAYVWSAQGLLQSYKDVSGVTTTYQYDEYGRLKESGDDKMKVAPGVDAMGRLAGWTATNLVAGSTFVTAVKYDELNREVERTISGLLTGDISITQDYYDNDQLKRRVTKANDSTLRNEKYVYDSRNRLVGYECSGASTPQEQGKHITSRTYAYDAFDNVTGIVTTFKDDSTDTATYVYDHAADPCRLTKVTHTHPKYPASTKFTYNSLGCLTTDRMGRTLDYDVLGRLTQVSQSGAAISAYEYDAFDSLVRQAMGDDHIDLYYRANQLANEIHGNSSTPEKSTHRYLRAGNNCAASRIDGEGAGTWLVGVDMAGSVLAAGTGRSTQKYSYTPYGHQDSDDGTPPVSLGYNGERQDPKTDVSHLGNGYRTYDPMLARFYAPDSLSPFGAGGINPYSYCAGDPVNNSDPSGHLSAQAWIGIGMGVLGVISAIASIFTFGTSLGVYAAIASAVTIGLEIVSGITGIVSGIVEESNPGLSSVLGWVSLGTGLLSFGVGVGMAAAKASARVLSRATAKVATEAVDAAEEGIDLGTHFKVFTGGRKVGEAPRSIVSAHGAQVLGKVEAPAQLGYYAPHGKLVMVGQAEDFVGEQLMLAEEIGKGSTAHNYALSHFEHWTSSELAYLAKKYNTDIIVVKNNALTKAGLVTTSTLFDTLAKAGVRYKIIDMVHCRGPFLKNAVDFLFDFNLGLVDSVAPTELSKILPAPL